MRSSVKDVVRVVLVGFAVMLALPTAYRVWLAYHPQPERPGRTLTQFFEKAAEENALRLLGTPVAKWSEEEKKAEPQVRAWLEAHDRTVLPWEWTDEARRKDPDGCRKMWSGLFGERALELKGLLASGRKRLGEIEREIGIAETVHAHRTNQFNRIRETGATNGFPMTIRVERLTKGRFWGWNTRAEQVTVFSREDLYAPTNGWFGTEQRQIDRERAALAEYGARRRIVADWVSGLSELFASAEEFAASARRAEPVSDSQAMRKLLDVIRAAPPAGAFR